MRHRYLVITLLLAAVLAAHPPPAGAQPLQCQAQISWSTGAQPPVTVQFAGKSAWAGEPRYFWQFGDGGISDLQNPQHTYTASGDYQVVLRVIDLDVPDAVCRDTLGVLVGYIADPTCLASVDNRWSESSTPIRFTATVGLWPFPPPYTWTWSFGDGSTQTIQSSNPWVATWHGYTVPGTYWATLSMDNGSFHNICFGGDDSDVRLTTLVPQGTVGVEPTAREIEALTLEPPNPNPFRTLTAFAYVVPRSGPIHLAIFDPQGRRIATLESGLADAGRHTAIWQGRSDAGHTVGSGLYYAVLEQDGRTTSTRILRLN